MGLLSKQEIAEYALKTGFINEYVCDSKDCGKLIRPGELCVVLKWEKRIDGLQAIVGRIATKVRCMGCNEILHPRPEVVKVKNAGRGAKKVTAEVASGITINPLIRKIVMSYLKKNGGIEVGLLVGMLRKKKVVRELKAKEVSATLKGMRKLKMFRRKGNLFVLPKEKKKKDKIKA